jgi:hypothetical protein
VFEAAVELAAWREQTGPIASLLEVMSDGSTDGDGSLVMSWREAQFRWAPQPFTGGNRWQCDSIRDGSAAAADGRLPRPRGALVRRR